jgi:hypothetical protein
MTPATTLPFFPLWTFFFKAAYQGGIEVWIPQIFSYRILHAAQSKF